MSTASRSGKAQETQCKAHERSAFLPSPRLSPIAYRYRISHIAYRISRIAYRISHIAYRISHNAAGVRQVLEGLLAEDDSVPDVWYLAALCAHAGGDFEAALEAVAAGERLLAIESGEGVETLHGARGAAAAEGDGDSLAADFVELRVRRYPTMLPTVM